MVVRRAHSAEEQRGGNARRGGQRAEKGTNNSAHGGGRSVRAYTEAARAKAGSTRRAQKSRGGGRGAAHDHTYRAGFLFNVGPSQYMV